MFGVYAMESIRLNAEQIEAGRFAILKTVGRKQLKMWVRVFPHIPVTKKPLEVRMGKGKGSVDHFVAYVKAGSYCTSSTVHMLAWQKQHAGRQHINCPLEFVS
jgi:ribosomal protein L16